MRRIWRIEARLETEQRLVHLLVNNAGSETEHGRFVERDRELLVAEVELNVLALMRLTHAAIGAMSSRGLGHVINVSAGNADGGYVPRRARTRPVPVAPSRSRPRGERGSPSKRPKRRADGLQGRTARASPAHSRGTMTIQPNAHEVHASRA